MTTHAATARVPPPAVTPEAIAAASVAFLPFVALFLALAALVPPSDAERSAADPLVQLALPHLDFAGLAVISAAPALAWTLFVRPSTEALRGAGRQALAALAVVGLGLPLLRMLVGPSLPAFVPPEESAAPGLTLGVAAGVLEESVFRLGILALVFVATLRSVRAPGVAAGVAIFVTALTFALSHELGPGAGDFSARFFATRFAIPGVVMSVLFFRPGPSFLVTLHCAAHVGIALLFTGEGAPP